jgi:lysophospholipase L1-like esterase
MPYALVSDLSLALNFVCAAYWLHKRSRGGTANGHVQMRRDLYRDADQHKTSASAVVMFGDSLTGAGLWTEWYGTAVLNRGIGGETTREALERAADLADIRPARVFILLGTNDYPAISPEESGRNVESIVQMLRQRSPETAIYIQSLFPPPGKGQRELWVRSLNQTLQAVAARHGAGWIDLYSVFADGAVMRHGLSSDGVHLTLQGYALWRQALAAYDFSVDRNETRSVLSVCPEDGSLKSQQN